ncbi:MAG: hypothetical protein ACX93T_00315 [Bacteroidota bacterium]
MVQETKCEKQQEANSVVLDRNHSSISTVLKAKYAKDDAFAYLDLATQLHTTCNLPNSTLALIPSTEYNITCSERMGRSPILVTTPTRCINSNEEVQAVPPPQSVSYTKTVPQTHPHINTEKHKWPDLAVLFVDATGLRSSVAPFKEPRSVQSCEQTIAYIQKLSNTLKETVTGAAWSTKWLYTQQDMQDYLRTKGECGYYSSEIHVVEIQQNDLQNPLEKWVVKVEPIPEEHAHNTYRHSWYSIMGELIAYQLSKKLALNLVPETRLILFLDAWGIRIGTAKPLLSSLSSEIPELTCYTDNHRVQLAKAFCFITGQWDLRRGNISMNKHRQPVLVDNECVLTPASEVLRVNNYGDLLTKKSYIKIGSVAKEMPNIGSQDNPLRLNKTKLAVLMGLDTSNECSNHSLLLPIAPEECETATETFKIIIKDNQVYRHFDTSGTLYMPYCAKEVLEKLEGLNEDSILEAFDETILLIQNLVYTLEGLPLDRGAGYIPVIDDADKILEDLIERYDTFLSEVLKRKQSFYNYHFSANERRSDSQQNCTKAEIWGSSTPFFYFEQAP